jgi:hypothetical protein
MAESKKKISWSSAWADARVLLWAHRRRLMLGAVLMIVNQAMGLVFKMRVPPQPNPLRAIRIRQR